MSRIGKKPIPLPPGVKTRWEERTLTVDGPLGTLSRVLPQGVDLVLTDKEITIQPRDSSRPNRASWGLSRTLVANMVTGVSQGFSRSLELLGTGYKVELKGQTLVFSLGYSSPVEFSLPAGITAQVDKGNKIEIKGKDKEQLGQTAANLRRLRPPDAYKGKGVRFVGEKLRRKVGKAGGR